MELALWTQDLTRRFDRFVAVDGVSLQVEKGSFYGFLGPNGAGKSTTIKMLTGLLAPTQGSLSVLGFDPTHAEESLEMKRRIGVVPEDLALFDNLTARENLLFVGRMHGLGLEVVDRRTKELLELMELDRTGDKIALEFSHGMRKKLALAVAMLPDPDLLFLDEPFEGVDAVASKVIRDTLHRFMERGSTLFLTSHVLEIVERLCTHVGIIAGGKLVEQTSLEELRRGASLEQRFLELVGNEGREAHGLSWLGGAEE